MENRSAYATMMEEMAKIEDSPLGRIVGFVSRFRDLSDMPHFVEKGKAEAGIRQTDEVLSRDCSASGDCVAEQAYQNGELQVHPLA